MTADEIDRYINQIAFSGAEEFLEKYKKDAQAIIGHIDFQININDKNNFKSVKTKKLSIYISDINGEFHHLKK
jgi:hypothetical protein